MTAVGGIMLPSAFYIGSHWGTIGIATAWTIAHPLAVYFPSNARAFRRLNLPITDYVRALWPAISASLLMIAALLLARASTPVATPAGLRLGLEIIVGAIVYAVSIMIFHRERVTSFLAVWRRQPE
jgi:hypothetical protein